MIAAAEAAGAEWELVYGGRQRASMAFLDELAAYGDRVTVSPQDEAGLLDLPRSWAPRGRAPWSTAAAPNPCWPRSSRTAGVAGEIAARGALRRQTCRRTGAGRRLRGAPRPERPDTHGPTGAFDPRRGRGGRHLGPVLLPRGHLRIVRGPVVSGEPDHRDSVLDEDDRAANDCMMVCVSRSCGARLVLDL